MSAFKAELTVEGKIYKLKHCAFNYRQNVLSDGTPNTKVLGGLISVVLEDPAPKEIIQWMLNPNEKRSGTVRFYEVNSSIGTYQLLEFAGAYCVQFANTFNGDKHSAGALLSDFTIATRKISFEGIEFAK